MLRSFKLTNKPLCMIENGTIVYIGDARGNILALYPPYLSTRHITNAPAPISALCFHLNLMIYGTWDGIVYSQDSSHKLGRDPIKCICSFNGKIFVSVDKQLVVLDSSLKILEKYDTRDKIYCMQEQNGRLYLGMGMGLISTYESTYEKEMDSGHSSTVLSMNKGLTGSCDQTLRSGKNAVLYRGTGWIRSIWDKDLFSCGKDVIVGMKRCYSHEDDVMGVLRVNGTIISIGLDFCYKVSACGLDEEEEQRLMDLLNS